MDRDYSYSLTERTRRLVRHAFDPTPARGTTPRVLANDGIALRANGQLATATWIGHATFLIQLDGVNILTDPNWSERASPVSFLGPRRLVPPGLAFDDLPPIHAVVISHDHYDHLDARTIKRLVRAHQPVFFVPLGVGRLARNWGVHDAAEVDWWQTHTLRGIRFTATPAQHSSGRWLHDQNRTLWASWVIGGPQKRFYFAGDVGYSAHFKEIGSRLGPFDLAAMPIGGYLPYSRRHPNHLNPEEAVHASENLGARLVVPMHWATFDLNREPFVEPLNRMMAAAVRRGLEGHVIPLSHGQSIHW